ncbi:MAG: hypothetical protein Kilf2KO_41170 [Rhodospirillales bacterium]
MPKIVDKDEVRNAILDAALQVFVEKGYHAASVSNVAAAVGVAKGTLYIYFDSKEALTTALVDRHFASIAEQLMREAPCETLDAFIDGLRRAMDIPADQASYYRVFFEVFGPSFASDAFTDNVAKFFDRLGTHYAKQIAYLQRVGEVPAHHDAAATGRALVGMLDGMVLHRGLFGIPERRHRRMTQAAVLLLGEGLRSAPRKAERSMTQR